MAARYNQRWEEMEKSGTPLDKLFETYALFNRSEAKAGATISWYDDKLREFARWLEAQGGGTDLGEFTIDRVREFVPTSRGGRTSTSATPSSPPATRSSPRTRSRAT